jgi:hypothetical protein
MKQCNSFTINSIPTQFKCFKMLLLLKLASHGCLDTLGKVVCSLKQYFIDLFKFFYITLSNNAQKW